MEGWGTIQTPTEECYTLSSKRVMDLSQFSDLQCDSLRAYLEAKVHVLST